MEVSLEDKHFQINPGDVYIYMASTLVHLLHKSEDAEGVMVEVDLDYIIPIVNRVINVENQLFMRKHPCISLSDKQRAHLEYLLDNLRERIEAEDVQEVNLQQQRLTLELIKSMGKEDDCQRQQEEHRSGMWHSEFTHRRLPDCLYSRFEVPMHAPRHYRQEL